MKFVKTNQAFTGRYLNPLHENEEFQSNEDETYLLIGKTNNGTYFGLSLVDMSCRGIFIPFFIKETVYSNLELDKIIKHCFIELDKDNGS